jgi:transposase
MPRTNPAYPPEFNTEAVRLAQSGDKSIATIAHDIVADQTLRSWVQQAEINAGTRDGLTTTEREELRGGPLGSMRRENRVLTQEREILKNAPARGAPRRMKMGRWLYWARRPEREVVAFRCRQSP